MGKSRGDNLQSDSASNGIRGEKRREQLCYDGHHEEDVDLL